MEKVLLATTHITSVFYAMSERHPLFLAWQQGVLLSGRASFELIQKAAMFGAEMLVAVGPLSSLACELADACGMTLVGFTNDAGANIYTHAQRVQRD